MTSASGPRVALLLLDGAVFFDVGTVLTVFGAKRPGTPRPDLGYRLTVCSAGGRSVTTSQGLTVSVDAGLEALREAELVVVPGTTPDLIAGQDDAVAAVAAAHRRGARVMSVCTGAFVLAAAGLLDGRRATTHWGYCDRLAAEYPAVRVDPDVLYIDDGDVLTSAGISAGMDLCLHVVRGDLGADAAMTIARWNVVAPHRDGGQAQFIATPVPDVRNGGGLARTRAWALEHLVEPLTVRDLARHAHMSTRSFARHFVAETGSTPKQWLLAHRVQHARRLLETTQLSIEEVAARSGFGSAAALRIHFERVTATRPTSYRSAFRGAGEPEPATLAA
jgi:AraC family transcriptional regulator, transcriptional activator FtrA